MPWYATPIPPPPLCGDDRCQKRATQIVRNQWNEDVGYRCTKHADELVARFNDAETAPGPPPNQP